MVALNMLLKEVPWFQSLSLCMKAYNSNQKHPCVIASLKPTTITLQTHVFSTTPKLEQSTYKLSKKFIYYSYQFQQKYPTIFHYYWFDHVNAEIIELLLEKGKHSELKNLCHLQKNSALIQ